MVSWSLRPCVRIVASATATLACAIAAMGWAGPTDDAVAEGQDLQSMADEHAERTLARVGADQQQMIRFADASLAEIRESRAELDRRAARKVLRGTPITDEQHLCLADLAAWGESLETIGVATHRWILDALEVSDYARAGDAVMKLDKALQRTRDLLVDAEMCLSGRVRLRRAVSTPNLHTEPAEDLAPPERIDETNMGRRGPWDHGR